MTSNLKIVVAIATAGRREQLPLTFAQLAKQRIPPERIVVCPAAAEDYDERCTALVPCPVAVIRGPRGICRQRNAILNACMDADLFAFFDDDFYPAPDYIEHALALFERHPDIVVATNRPALDGVSGPGITHEEAARVSEGLVRPVPAEHGISELYAGYGCNMVIRAAPVRAYGVRFDEQLPLYGWLEDVDFSRRLARHGRVVTCRELDGVHLGSKGGRLSGIPLGYSQVANPWYLYRKGSINPGFALISVARNVGKNGLRFIRPEPWVDRRGRLRGNAIALSHLIAGRLHPLAAQDVAAGTKPA